MMGGDSQKASFPVHGGTCTVVDNPLEMSQTVAQSEIDSNSIVIESAAPHRNGVVRIRQSMFRHLHPVFVLVTVICVLSAVASAFTGWQHVSETGDVYYWYEFLLLGLLVPGLRGVQLGWRRLRGYTGTSRVLFDDVDSIELTTTSLSWYAKRRKTVPLYVVHYTDDGSEKRRRILLDPRWDPAQLQRSIDAFREAGLPLRIDDAVHEVAPDITCE